MKSPFGLGLLAVMTTASLALAQGTNGGSGSAPPTTETNSYQEMDMISMAPGEGITFDMGDEFMLNLRNLIQFSYSYASLDNKGVAGFPTQNYNNFNMDRARTYLTGHLFDPSIEYQLNFEWTDGGAFSGSPLGDPIRPTAGSVVKDANVTWMFWENEDSQIGTRVGQSKTGFGRQGTGWEGAYEFAYGRQIATRTFASLRTRGAWVGGNHTVGDNMLHWHVGAQNGDVAGGAFGVAEYGEETPNPDSELSFLGVVSYDTAEDLGGEWGTEGDLMHREEFDWGVGAGIFLGNNRAGGVDVESTEWNVNAVLKTKGFAASGEYFDREDDSDAAGMSTEDSDGYQVQASYTTAPASTQYGFVLGASRITVDGQPGAPIGSITYMTGTPLGTTSGDVYEYSAGIDLYYHERNLRTTFAYVRQNVDPDGATPESDNDIFVVQVQIVF